MKAVNFRDLSLIWLIMTLLAAPVISAHGAAQPVRIKLETQREIVQTGHVIDILVTLTNISSQAIAMSESEEKDGAAASEYFIRVLTDDANAPLTEKGERIYERSELLVPGIYRSTILQPGDALMADASVTDIYDLTQPGHYVIWVERKLPTELGGGYVSSNTITVTVTK